MAEAKLLDELEVIMTAAERRTLRRTEIKSHVRWCGQGKGRWSEGQTSGKVEGSRLLGVLQLKAKK